MKRLTVKPLRTLTLALLAAVALAFVGCEQNSPLASVNEDSMISRPTAVTASGKTIHFLSIGEKHLTSLNKVSTVQKYINRSYGGEIELEVEQGDLEIEFELEIPSNSIDYSKTVTMTYDDQNSLGFTDLVFGPHGTQFSKPAKLEIEIEGLDLSGIDPDKVKFYYINDNGQWEEIAVESIEVDLADEEVEIEGARIDHFSRYAVASE